MTRILTFLLVALLLAGCGAKEEKQLPTAVPQTGVPATKPVPLKSVPAPSPAQPAPHPGNNEPSRPDGKYKEFGYGGDGMSSPILFDKVIRDFGVVKKGAKVVEEYFYKNTSNHSVEIERVLVSCNCITVEYKKEPIHPGETGTIRVTFHTEDQTVALYEKLISIQQKGSGIVQALLLKGRIVN